MMQATTMGPPPTPMGYSLRVKLCTADDATESAKRWFRVSASPDITIREFCTEASRIHERNYGSPIAIKKCTDDEGFDVMQDDFVGQLFPNMSIIRIIQAPTRSTVRDSLPPSSALRFTTPSVVGQKRVREEWNGVAKDFWENSQKRQRVITDPDHPLPSRETDSRNGMMSQRNLERLESPFIPDSQQDPVLVHKDELGDNSHEVRIGSPAIRETPPPTPQPEVRNARTQNHRLTNSTFKPTTSAPHNRSEHARKHPLSPVQEASPRSSPTSPNGAQAGGTTSHVQQNTNRESSSSTRAVSPLLGEPELPVHDVARPAKQRTLTEPKRSGTNTGTPNSMKPRDERSVYDDFGTDSEDTTVRSRGVIKPRKSPRAGLPGTEMAAKFSTPPGNSNRVLQPVDQISTPGTLPLTPKSREREREAQLQQNKQAETGREARKAETKELEAQKAKENEHARLRKEIEEEDAANAANAAIVKASKQTEKRESTRKSSKSSEPQEERRSSTPKGTPSTAIRPSRSSTPHIPSGRKSALKKIPSSQAAPSLSPEAVFKDVSLEAQIPLPPKKSPRRVSFNVNDTNTPTRPEAIKPAALNKPREESTPESSSSRATGQVQTPIPLPKTIRRPALKPQTSNPITSSQSPMVQKRASSVASSVTPKPAVKSTAINGVVDSSEKATPKPGKTNKGKPDPPTKPAAEPPKPTKPPTPTESSESESDDEPVKPSPKKSVSPVVTRPGKAQEETTNDIADEDVDMTSDHSSRESRSPVIFHSNAPSRDEQQQPLIKKNAAPELSSSEAESSDEEVDTPKKPGTKSLASSSENQDKHDTSESTSGEESETDEEEDDGDSKADEHQSSPELPRHPHTQRDKGNGKAPSPDLKKQKQKQRKPSGASDDESNTQLEVDQQLTSDMIEAHAPPSSTPIPVPTPKAVPRPQFNFGASLSALNARKSTPVKPQRLVGAAASQRQGVGAGVGSRLAGLVSSQREKKGEEEESEEEEDDEDDESSEDESDDDDEEAKLQTSQIQVPATSQVTSNNRTTTTANKQAKNSKDDSDSDWDSDSDSDSDDGSVDLEDKIRNDLVKQINGGGPISGKGMTGSQGQAKGASQGKEAAGSAVGKVNGKAKLRSAGKEFGKKGGDVITNGFQFNHFGSLK